MFILATGAAIAMVGLAVEAQQAGRLPRIGILLPWSTGAGTEVLRHGLRDLGYVKAAELLAIAEESTRLAVRFEAAARRLCARHNLPPEALERIMAELAEADRAAHRMGTLRLETMHEIGVEPTGMPFNSVMAVEIHNDGPVTIWLDTAELRGA